eukprot:s597_g28.t1
MIAEVSRLSPGQAQSSAFQSSPVGPPTRCKLCSVSWQYTCQNTTAEKAMLRPKPGQRFQECMPNQLQCLDSSLLSSLTFAIIFSLASTPHASGSRKDRRLQTFEHTPGNGQRFRM